MIRTFLFGCCYVLALGLQAQQVSTYWVQPTISFEAIAWHSDGRIYTPAIGTKVYKLVDSVMTVLPGNFASPTGAAFDAAGNFYFSEYQGGTVIKVDPNDSISVYATGFFGPTGILIDDDEQLMYVANYDRNRISRVDMQTTPPTVTTLANGGLINGPDGLAFSPEGDIISANFNDSSIQRITLQGDISRFAVLSNSPNSGYIVRGDSSYYITAAFGHDVYEISFDGVVSLLAGDGQAGTKNGDADTARFRLANGIALSPTGDSLIIAETHAGGLLRLITGLKPAADTLPTDLYDRIDPEAFSFSPNPAAGRLDIRFELATESPVSLSLLDLQGRTVDTLLPLAPRRGLITHRYSIPANISQGVYLLRLQAGAEVLSRRVQLGR